MKQMMAVFGLLAMLVSCVPVTKVAAKKARTTRKKAGKRKRVATRSKKRPRPRKRPRVRKPRKRRVRVSRRKSLKKKPQPALKSLSSWVMYKPKNKAQKRALKRLSYQIRRALRVSRLRGAKLGVVVMDTKGRVLYAKRAKKSLIPASNLKILTMAVALKVLGYHYRFKTVVSADSPINEKGEVQGNIYIKGSGDPSLRSEELWRIVRDLWMKGLRKVTGRVIFDASVFDRKRFGAGWTDHSNQPKEKYRPYLAPIGGFALNYSTVGISVRPGAQVDDKAKVLIDPKSYYFRRVINKTKTVSQGRLRVRFRLLPFKGYRDQLEIKGTVPLNAKAKLYWRRINFPGWYAGFQFAQFLKHQRIQVNRWPKRGRAPSDGTVLYTHYSPPLGQILQYVGKNSSNFTAEQVLKTVGAKKYGRPGTWMKGLKAMQSYLADIGLKPGTYVALNGSGLSRSNRLSPFQLATVLRAMLKEFSLRSEFLSAQATSGRDGTLRWRMNDRTSSGNIRAKTGTLDGVSALSGYAHTRDKRLLIFSIIMNGKIWQGKHFRRAQNKIGKALARFSF